VRTLRRDKWNPSKWSFVCCKHFKETYYVTPPGLPNPRLKRNAVPSMFDFHKHLQAPQKFQEESLHK